jgi:ATP-dependent DNA helicase RecG
MLHGTTHMNTALAQLGAWMQAEAEDEHLEFKEAKSSFDPDELERYCSALANEGGGSIIFGVTNKRPRRVVGTGAFSSPSKVSRRLFDVFRFRVEVEAVNHPDGRVVIVTVPALPESTVVGHKGSYWMRSGESLVAMTVDQIMRKVGANETDFSSRVCRGADLSSLDRDAISVLRERWHARSGNPRLNQLADQALLQAANLAVDHELTNAALILMGTESSLRRHQLGQAEIILEYRSDPEKTRYDDRESYKDGFLLCAGRIWERIGLRNEVYQVQEGLFRRDIRSFGDVVVREALLNAVTHRDYRLSGSVVIRQSPNRLEVESPGGFPPGVTIENILHSQSPRNRLIAETFERCGYVERSGQGVDLMFEESIKDAKLPPDYARSDEYAVRLTLQGQVQDPSFIRFLERVDNETQVGLHLEDYLVLDCIRREQPIHPALRPRLPILRGLSVIEATGRGKGTRYILSRRYYEFAGRRGTYTKSRGLDWETNKELLSKHITDYAAEGSRLRDCMDVLPSLSRNQVQGLLRELKVAGRAHTVGRTRGARWYPGRGAGGP